MSISYAVFCLFTAHLALHSFPTRRSSDLPDDPIVAYFLSAPGAIEVDKLHLDSPALTALRAAGVKLAIPLVSQGELVGLLNLGPRLSEQDRSEEHTSELQSHVNLVCRLLLVHRPPSPTLFPYTTLFRSARRSHRGLLSQRARRHRGGQAPSRFARAHSAARRWRQAGHPAG